MERDGDGEDGEDPAEHWWLPQPGKPGEQLLLLEIEPLLLVLGGEGGPGVDDEQRHQGGLA